MKKKTKPCLEFTSLVGKRKSTYVEEKKIENKIKWSNYIWLPSSEVCLLLEGKPLFDDLFVGTSGFFSSTLSSIDPKFWSPLWNTGCMYASLR